MICIILLYSLLIIYSIVIQLILNNWNSNSEFQLSNSTVPKTKVSIIIPVRNEAENILDNLRSIQQLNYPKDLLEAIYVDDYSTDDTARLLNQHIDQPIILLELAKKLPDQEGGKKNALTKGIQYASGELIITTDGDCSYHPDWANSIVQYYEEHGPKLIAGPVLLSPSHTILERFQSLDLIGMMGVTCAGIKSRLFPLGNGACLAYAKKIFLELEGFSSIDHIASGDDILFVQKVQEKYPDQIHFLKSKEAIVTTRPESSLSAFFQQRLRWSSKNKSYKARSILLLQLIVFLLNLCLLVGIICAMICCPEIWKFILSAILIKMVVDYFYLRPIAQFFQAKKVFRYYPISSILTILYIPIMGITGLISRNINWKGRTVKG